MRKGLKKSTSRWQRDPDKEKFWREKVKSWRTSGLSIRAFCRRHNISETSFYAWRRELRIRDRETDTNSVQPASDSLPPKVKDSRGRLIAVKFREQVHHESTESNSPFVPLKLVSATQKQSKDEVAVPESNIEIVSPNGFTIRISKTTDLNLLSQVVHTLEDNNV